MNPVSLFRLIFVFFLHYWRMNLAVAAGTAAGTAVLTGALLVGDSMRGSLQSLALDRLGKIDEVLAPGRFFREKLADELKETGEYKAYGEAMVPAILLPASMENPDTQVRANRIEVIGCNEDFGDLFPSFPVKKAAGDDRKSDQEQTAIHDPNGPRSNPRRKDEGTTEGQEIDLNQPLAEKLGVKAGDEVILRLPRPGMIPSDSALGEKRNTVQGYRLTVRSILSATGAGCFSLQPNQQEPLNAYVPLGWLQERLEQAGKVNTLLLSVNDKGRETIAIALNAPQEDAPSQSLLHPIWKYFFGRSTSAHVPDNNVNDSSTSGMGIASRDQQAKVELKDYGISTAVSPRGFINVTSDRMILEPGIETGIFGLLCFETRREKPAIQSVFTYLANSIADNDREIPYSTITALDFAADPPLGPFLSPEGKPLPPLGENEIALNAWAASDLKAKVGDTIKVTYFEPESTHGQIGEKTAELRLAAIVQLAGAAADRDFAPKVKGITDELTMANWDPPFPFDAKRVRAEDEAYWDEHGPTPKAFVSLATGRKLWGSRFGHTTSFRIASKERDPQKAKDELLRLKEELEKQRFRLPSMGFAWQPVKLQGLAAAQGTTPFNVLFLGFSFFIIAAALMLVLLLFKLGVERRAAEIGILLAVGWRPRQVRKLLFREGILTAAAGGLIGVPLGIGYAALMLWGLQTWWLAAIVTPFLKLYVTPGSLLIGFFMGFLTAMATIFFAVRKISRFAPRQLLAGLVQKESRLISDGTVRKDVRWIDLLWLVFLMGNVIVWFFTRQLSDLQAGIFLGGGALMLLLTLGVIWHRLQRGATGAAVAVGGGNLFRLAMRNAARHPGRSTLTIGLVASACFLIVAVSAFQLDPSQQTPTRDSGNGGFALAGESNQPIFQNLDTPDGRAALGFSQAEEEVLSQCRIYALRVRPGDDASCLNLYRPRSPRILGLPPSFIARDGFSWANAPSDCKNPWSLLEASQGNQIDDKYILPMILEKNTANYSLNLWGGLGETYEYQQRADKQFTLQTAALLGNSLFQGDLLISEDALLKKFPETGGYRFFLVECSAEKAADAQKILENRLSDYGFTAETTGKRLARFLAVQNTYLSTFQSLGGLGLLLGTFGLAAVELRNILERRGELALLRAVGFSRRKLALLVVWENAVLLLLGLGSGTLAALVAVMPHFLSSVATVPWVSLAVTLGFVLLVGLLAGLTAVRQVLKAPLLGALRADR